MLMMMKLFLVPALLSVATTATADSPCNAAPDPERCGQTLDENGIPCQWCKSGAIPSECMSAEQAKTLPPGVFDCATPGFLFGNNRYYQLVHQDEPDYSDLCDDSSKSLSGYMDIKGSDYDANGENKHLFFWMFESRHEADETTPFMVWLTGGPGCSSTLALLTENGPCTVNKDGKSTSINEFSWTEAAHVLWLDQPAGVGFSYGQETDSNEAMVSEDAYYFMQAFMKLYPQYSKNPLFIVGESYGGHYAPAIAHRIWQGNQQQSQDGTIELNLAGLAIGNGLTDPEHQYPSYVDMGTHNSHNIVIFDDEVAEAMRQVIPRCTQLIHSCNSGDSMINDFACQAAFVVCNTGLTSPYQMTGLNPYDIRKMCEVPPLCYDFSHIQKFLNLESTRASLKVDVKHSHAWESCNFGINMKFHTDWMKDFSGYVKDLLEAGIPALIYAGDVDFICNYLGNKAWVTTLDWKGGDEFKSAVDHDWEGVGLARTAQGLTFLQVYDAGHMVPSDQPKVALDMISNFLNGGDF